MTTLAAKFRLRLLFLFVLLLSGFNCFGADFNFDFLNPRQGVNYKVSYTGNKLKITENKKGVTKVIFDNPAQLETNSFYIRFKHDGKLVAKLTKRQTISGNWEVSTSLDIAGNEIDVMPGAGSKLEGRQIINQNVKEFDRLQKYKKTGLPVLTLVLSIFMAPV